MAPGLSKVIVAGLFVSGLLGFQGDFLQQFVEPDSVMLWHIARLAPIALGLIYLAVIQKQLSPLIQALVLLPAILTTVFIEQISLPLEVEWLVGLALAYQEFDVLLWLSLFTVLCAHHLRQPRSASQPLNYTRRLLLTVCMFCMLGIWLLPAMGDTLLARSERWFTAWETENLASHFPHHTAVTFWLETAGLSIPIILLGLQTALIQESKSRHSWACVIAIGIILVATAIRVETQSGAYSLLGFSVRNAIFFVSTAMLASLVAAKAWIFWHLPIPKRSQGEPPSIRAELLAARMAYQTQDSAGPAYRKSVKRLVDKCHRALEREAKEKSYPPSAWIHHRLQPDSDPNSACPETDNLNIGNAPALHHYLARGRRLEIVLLTWLLLIAIGWSEWRVHQSFAPLTPSTSSPFESAKLWQQGLKAGLLNTPGDKNSAEALAQHIAPQLKRDIVWKLQNIQKVHGIPHAENIFTQLVNCAQVPQAEAPPEACQNSHLLEPLILTSLETLEQARLQHLAKLPKTWRAPQMLRDLTKRHPDLDALELSRELSSQLAALQERFMARSGLFALILAADQQSDSVVGESATIILNLLAPSQVLYDRLYEDTRRLSARASALYTVVFGRPLPAPIEENGSGSEEPLGLLK